MIRLFVLFHPETGLTRKQDGKQKEDSSVAHFNPPLL
jgi:hypothetical protein